jgi:hypothetical protein
MNTDIGRNNYYFFFCQHNRIIACALHDSGLLGKMTITPIFWMIMKHYLDIHLYPVLVDCDDLHYKNIQ